MVGLRHHLMTCVCTVISRDEAIMLLHTSLYSIQLCSLHIQIIPQSFRHIDIVKIIFAGINLCRNTMYSTNNISEASILSWRILSCCSSNSLADTYTTIIILWPAETHRLLPDTFRLFLHNRYVYNSTVHVYVCVARRNT